MEQYVAPKGRRVLTAAQTVGLLRSLMVGQRDALAKPGQRLEARAPRMAAQPCVPREPTDAEMRAHLAEIDARSRAGMDAQS